MGGPHIMPRRPWKRCPTGRVSVHGDHALAFPADGPAHHRIRRNAGTASS